MDTFEETFSKLIDKKWFTRCVAIPEFTCWLLIVLIFVTPITFEACPYILYLCHPVYNSYSK